MVHTLAATSVSIPTLSSGSVIILLVGIIVGFIIRGKWG